MVVRLRTGFDRKVYPSATSEALRRAVRAELLTLLGRIARPGAAA
jgi:ribonuclease P protein component